MKSEIITCKYGGRSCLKKFIATHENQKMCLKCMVQSDTLSKHPLIRRKLTNPYA